LEVRKPTYFLKKKASKNGGTIYFMFKGQLAWDLKKDGLSGTVADFFIW
jgi:hypothetical protein